MKSNKTNIFAKIILILIILVLALLVYEIVFEDILGIMKNENNPISEVVSLKSANDKQTNLIKNTHIVKPNLDASTTDNVVTNKIRYYYNQLDKDAKIIYQGIEDNIENMQTGNYTIDFDKQFNELLNSDGGEEKLSIAFQSAWNAFTYDYTDIFYIDVTKLILTTQTSTFVGRSTHKVHLSNGNNASYLANGFNSSDIIKKEMSEIENIKNQIVSKLEPYNEYDKIKHVHNWLIDNLQYDTTYNKKNIHNIYRSV